MGQVALAQYGLIHGARGDVDKALPELERAAAAHPYPGARQRIAEAIELARAGAGARGD